MGPSSEADPLPAARQALERGEYGRVLRLLEPVAEAHGPATALGAGVRLLMATALMGQGQSERAAACCRSLQASPDAALRARARELLEVLEAPVLRRPRDWSLTLPDLSDGSGFEAVSASSVSRRRPPEPLPPPPAPVGATRAPIGFAALVLGLLALLLLASLLGGCVEVRTDLQFQGPGRLRVTQSLMADGGGSTPWQRRFGEALQRRGFQPVHRGDPRDWQTPVLPSEQALAALRGSLEDAADLAGATLPPPLLELRERNWLVGVRQELRLTLDLTDVADRPGLALRWTFRPLRMSAVRQAEPLAAAPQPDPGGRGHGPAVAWPLAVGQSNQLRLVVWRWSPLGLGGLLIAIALLLELTLQRLRLRLGFGLPELPA